MHKSTGGLSHTSFASFIPRPLFKPPSERQSRFHTSFPQFPNRLLPLLHARRGIRCGACARGAQVSTKQGGYRKVQRRSRCTRIRICIRALLSYT